MNKADERTMGKKEFIEELSMRLDVDVKFASKILLTVLDMFKDYLTHKYRLEFRGYFTLGSKYQKSRIARNVKTGEPVPVPKSRIAYFKPNQGLRDLDNPLP